MLTFAFLVQYTSVSSASTAAVIQVFEGDPETYHCQPSTQVDYAKLALQLAAMLNEIITMATEGKTEELAAKMADRAPAIICIGSVDSMRHVLGLFGGDVKKVCDFLSENSARLTKEIIKYMKKNEKPLP